MRVAVIQPPVSIARDFIDYPYFADLGAVQLAAVLEREGFETELIDAYALAGSTLTWRPDKRAHLGAPVPEVLERVRPCDAAVVAYTPFHRPPRRCDVLGPLLAGLRAALGDTPLILADCYQSGQHYVEASASAVRASYPEIDAWVKYEAEVTVPALLRSGSIGGVHRGARPALDELPIPAWGAIDLDAYFAFHRRVVANLGRGAWAFPIDGRTIPLITSRGCPFTCVHCSSNPDHEGPEPKAQRRYGEVALRNYLTQLAAITQPTRLAVLDELINVNARHFELFLDVIDQLDVAFDVPNGMRADYLEPRHFDRMRDRVTTVSVSAESGVQRVVTDVVRKKLELGAIIRAAEHADAARVPLMIHYMIGLPGESAAEINQTLAFAMDLFDRFSAFPAVQFATPLPGTAMAKLPANNETLPQVDDWGPRFQTAPSRPNAEVSAADLRAFKRTFDERLRASSGPQKLIINVTYVCNNHCTFCAVGTRTQIHGHPTRQREHLDKYRAMGVRMVDFDGGEPTLNPELIGLIRYARRIGYERVNVTTNGRLCFYPDYARKLVRSGLTTLLFSVHGPDARTHAQQVGVAEAFEQTTGGIRNCLRAAPAGVKLGMNITVTKGNHDKLEEVAQLCWDLGLRWLNIQFLTPFGRATKFVAPDTQAAADLAAGVIDRWRDRLEFQIINLPFCFMPQHTELMVGDMGKLRRHMIFVNNEDVNLADYLAERRVRKPVCDHCPHAVFCGGFYELESAPEPPWLIHTDELLRKIEPLADPKRTLHLIDS